MKYLVDINVMLAAVWQSHPNHKRAFDWLDGKEVVTCPLTELGFLRISTQPAAFNSPMEDARALLKMFIDERQAENIPCDISALESNPKTSAQVSDAYLVELAKKHNLKLATMDKGIKHDCAVLI